MPALSGLGDASWTPEVGPPPAHASCPPGRSYVTTNGMCYQLDADGNEVPGEVPYPTCDQGVWGVASKTCEPRVDFSRLKGIFNGGPDWERTILHALLIGVTVAGAGVGAVVARPSYGKGAAIGGAAGLALGLGAVVVNWGAP